MTNQNELTSAPLSGSVLSTLYIALVYAENQSKQRKLVNHDSTHVNGKSTKKSRQDTTFIISQFSTLFTNFCVIRIFSTQLKKTRQTTTYNFHPFYSHLFTKFLCHPEFFNLTKKISSCYNVYHLLKNFSRFFSKSGFFKRAKRI